MGFSKTLLLVLSLSCLLIHTIAARAPAPAPSSAVAGVGAAWRRMAKSPTFSVVNICRDSTNMKLCVETILPAIKGRFTPLKALVAEIMATKAQILKTRDEINRLIDDPKTDKLNANCLGVCGGQYSHALDSIDEALTALNESSSPSEARFKMSGIISYLNSCDDTFTEMNIANPIGALGKVVTDLAGNSLDIVVAIQDREMKRVLRRFGGKLPPPPPEITRDVSDPCYFIIGPCVEH